MSSLLAGLPLATVATAVTSAGLWLLPLLLSLPGIGNRNPNVDRLKSTPKKKLRQTYDFIVVGAGSAGAVIANRLTEVERWNVLLLEAGGDERLISVIPALAAYMQLTDIDWQYKSEPQPQACLAFEGGRCNWPRGKVMGGCSSLNYMLYVRGNRRDYDSWAAMGNYGWDYETVLHYFKKSEDNKEYAKDKRYHGSGGYLAIQQSPFRTPLAAAFLRGGVELGYENRDGNAEFQTGFMIAQGTIRDGTRGSTSTSFIRPILHKRKNLHLSMYSRVLKVLVHPVTKRAYGVQYEKEGDIFEVYARKEVIVSTGSVGSPAILMHSGIGPRDHLAEMGIPVIADLPVGNNLQDHVAAGWMTFLLEKPVSLSFPRLTNLVSALQYMFQHNGPATVLGGVEGLAWVKTKYANQSDDYPDIEFHFVAGSAVSDGGVQVRRVHGINQRLWTEYFQPIAFRESFSIVPMLLRPRSNGYIRLRSPDPFDKPLIYPNYMVDEEDVKVLVDGVKIALALVDTQPFKKLGARFYAQPFPGCEHLPLWTDDYFACCNRHYSSTIYHPTGTCKMGPAGDKTAVVDPELRVYGINGLRVADCSIMPNVPSGNTNAPAIMVGEKAADMIKAYWLTKGL